MRKPDRQLETAASGVPDYVEHCSRILKESGARVTKPRLAVMRCLAESRQAMSPREIVERVRARRDLPSIDQVTVYRILETFGALGLVHQIGPSGDFVACSHFDCTVESHILTRCTVCGKTEEFDVPSEVISPLMWYLTHSLRFSPEEHYFQMNGICTTCRGASP